MSPIAGDAAELLTVQQFYDILKRVSTSPLLDQRLREDHSALLQHDTLSRQRILWLERENEELRYALGQAKPSSHALQRVVFNPDGGEM